MAVKTAAKIGLLLGLLIWLVWGGIAGAEDGTGDQPMAPVTLDGQEIFWIRTSVGSFSPEERAKAIEERLRKVAHDERVAPETLKTMPGRDGVEIIGGRQVLILVTEEDAVAEGKPLDSLVRQRQEELQSAIQQYRQERNLKTRGLDVAYVVALTLALWWIWILVGGVIRYWRHCWQEGKGWIPRYGARIQKYRLISAEQAELLVNRTLSLLHGLAALLLVYGYLHISLQIFPETRPYANRLFAYLLQPMAVVADAVIAYLPNMVIILIILLICRYVLKLVRVLFNQVKAGHVKLSGFYEEWADPSYKILRLLVLSLTLVSIFPYLPGSQSPVFQGVTVLIGVLFSLGSSSVVANMVAGTTLIYTRAFSIGDRVKIGEHVGDVVEKNMLATRIRTIKNVEITIPNALVLNSFIINYNTQSPEGLILHTKVTIGYEVPWPKVHELLIRAAKDTPDVLEEPKPFVLQTALDDFNVAYELNVYTRYPQRMVVIYSRLYQNIQDSFRDGKVEILSPRYVAVRDGNKPTIPVMEEGTKLE